MLASSVFPLFLAFAFVSALHGGCSFDALVTRWLRIRRPDDALAAHSTSCKRVNCALVALMTRWLRIRRLQYHKRSLCLKQFVCINFVYMTNCEILHVVFLILRFYFKDM